MFDASLFVDLHRMPELFCGFRRRPGEGPTLYPVACSPQAWAAGAVFHLAPGLSGSADRGRHRPRHTSTTRSCPSSSRRSASAASASVRRTVDLSFRRIGDDVAVNVLGRTGNLEVVVVK